MSGTYGGPNAEAIEAWDTVLFDKFTRFREVILGGLSIHGNAAMDRLALRPAARVLDVGCGFGDTTRELAARVGAGGEAVGVDGARRFIEAATEEAKRTNVQNARFAVRDVQADDLGGPYDAVFARFGTMFFASAVSALRNMERSLKRGGKLCIVVWRRREDNLWLHGAEKVVRELVPDMHDDRGDQVTCGPGPFSMAGADLVSEQMTKAGFDRISFERFDTPLLVGRDIDEAIEFAMALGPAGEIMRLAGEVGEKKKPEVVDALRKVFAEMQRPDGAVYGESSTWIITACPRGTSP